MHPTGIIYARVSDPASQATEDDVSIETQINDCHALARTLGIAVIGVCVDDKRYRNAHGLMVDPSGTRTDRPAWREMLARVERGEANVIIAWKEDRLLRGVRAAVAFGDVIEQTRVRVELVKEKFDLRMLYLKASIGKMEIDNIRERTTMGRVGRAKKGLTATRTSPYYTPVRDPATGRTTGYQFNETYRTAFDEMARLFLSRVSYREIHKRLGLNPRTGKRWGPESIRQILMNPFYRGEVHYGRRQRIAGGPQFTVPGKHPAAWDAETCAAIESEVARRVAIGSHAPRSKRAVFSGVLRCGLCQQRLSPNGSGSNNKRKKLFIFYDCYR